MYTSSAELLVVHDVHSIAASSYGAKTWLIGMSVREWGKLGVHMAVGLAIWAPITGFVWYVYWSLDNCQTEALSYCMLHMYCHCYCTPCSQLH